MAIRPARAIRARLLARAYQLLAELTDAIVEAITVSASDELANVTISLTPAGAAGQTNVQLSPLERDIVQAIGTGTLTGKQIASRAGYSFNATLRTILANLVAREVLTKTDQGYRVSAGQTEPR
jgi:hypothetical protein